MLGTEVAVDVGADRVGDDVDVGVDVTGTTVVGVDVGKVTEVDVGVGGAGVDVGEIVGARVGGGDGVTGTPQPRAGSEPRRPAAAVVQHDLLKYAAIA